MLTDIRRATADVTVAPAPAAARPYRAVRRGPPNPLPAVILVLFLLFFVIPVLWLVLAATKTDDQLVRDNPLSFGSPALRANWDARPRSRATRSSSGCATPRCTRSWHW